MTTSRAPARTLPDRATVLPPVKLAHVVFRTKQLPTMISWYETVLGARVMFGNAELAFLTYDDEHHRIALIGIGEMADRPAQTTVGFYHVAFTWSDLGQLLSTYRRLRDAGITPWRAIRHGATVSFYYHDPDGNDVELQIDVFSTAEEVNAFLNGPAYAADPIGILFDPDVMIADYERGVALEKITRREDDQPSG